MKITEIITEAHHSRLVTHKMGDWTVHFDSHLMATIPDRQIPLEDVVNITTYACLRYADELRTIPRGKGAYFQDTNTLISIYIRRNQHYPNEITVETVLSPDMKPTPPLFRRPIPSHGLTIDKQHQKTMDYYRQQTQARGRDAVSQDLETAKFGQGPREMKPELMSKEELDIMRQKMNREQRRMLDKYLRKKGLAE
jgi:hypothetical protein